MVSTGLRSVLDFHLTFTVRQLVRVALGIFIALFLYECGLYVHTFWKRFAFHGELRTFKAWNPFGAPPTKRRVLIVCPPRSLVGDTTTAQYLSQAFRDKGFDTYICYFPLFNLNKKAINKRMHRIHRFLNRFLKTELGFNIYNLLQGKDYRFKGIPVHYICNYSVHWYPDLEGEFFKADGILYGGDTQWLEEKFIAQRDLGNHDLRKPPFLFFPLSTNDIHPSGPAEPKKIFWCGSNWDKARGVDYLPLFKGLCEDGVIDIYGNKVWKSPKMAFARGCYQGFLPYEDVPGFFQKVREAGITLCLHGPLFNQYGITTNRLMEGASAATVIIADRNPFTLKHFGDSVLYVDQTKPPLEMLAQIRKHLAWIKANPEEAKAMAWRAHLIFKEKFALDKLVDRFLKWHEGIKQQKELALFKEKLFKEALRSGNISAQTPGFMAWQREVDQEKKKALKETLKEALFQERVSRINAQTPDFLSWQEQVKQRRKAELHKASAARVSAQTPGGLPAKLPSQEHALSCHCCS